MEQYDVNLCLAIKAAVTECIENMVFMSIVDETDHGANAQYTDSVIASVRVLEPQRGMLYLEMPIDTAQEITKNLYSAADTELSNAMIQDMACELLNTISGRVMKRILPDECMFQLGIPETVDKQTTSGKPFVRCSFLADEKPLVVAAHILLNQPVESPR